MENKIAAVTSSEIKNGVRFIKVTVMGKDDVQNIKQLVPYGFDSAPIADDRAMHMETLQFGENFIAGYVGKNQEAKPGESRMFSTDVDGNLQTFIFLKDDGTIEIGGDADNMIRYAPFNSELQNFKNQIQAELALISAGIAAAGGSYTPGILTLDLSASKIDEVKTT